MEASRTLPKSFAHLPARTVRIPFCRSSFLIGFANNYFRLFIGCIVLLSGPTDYLSDGSTVIRLSNGHELLGQITGAGCMLGTIIAAFCGAKSMVYCGPRGGSLVCGDMLLATAGATLALTIAAQQAGGRNEVRGPGTFLPALIDELAMLTPEIVLRMATIEVEME